MDDVRSAQYGQPSRAVPDTLLRVAYGVAAFGADKWNTAPHAGRSPEQVVATRLHGKENVNIGTDKKLSQLDKILVFPPVFPRDVSHVGADSIAGDGVFVVVRQRQKRYGMSASGHFRGEIDGHAFGSTKA